MQQIQEDLFKIKRQYDYFILAHYQSIIQKKPRANCSRSEFRNQQRIETIEKVYQQMKRQTANFFKEVIPKYLEISNLPQTNDDMIDVEIDILTSRYDFVLHSTQLDVFTVLAHNTILMPCPACSSFNEQSHDIIFRFHLDGNHDFKYFETKLEYRKVFQIKWLWHADTKRIVTYNGTIHYWISLLPKEVLDEILTTFFPNLL